MSAELILEHILSQAIEHCWTEESPAINSRWAATGLKEQGHTELHKNTSSLCERWDGQLEHALGKYWLMTLNIEHSSDCQFLQCYFEICNEVLQKL